MDMVCKGDANFFTIHTFFQFNVEFTFFLNNAELALILQK